MPEADAVLQAAPGPVLEVVDDALLDRLDALDTEAARDAPSAARPWADVLSRLRRELEALHARVQAGEWLLHAIRKMHAEWPRNPAAR